MKVKKLVSSLTFSSLLLTGSLTSISLLCFNSHLEQDTISDNFSFDSNPIDNFIKNVNNNHQNYLNDYLENAQTHYELNFKDIGFTLYQDNWNDDHSGSDSVWIENDLKMSFDIPYNFVNQTYEFDTITTPANSMWNDNETINSFINNFTITPQTNNYDVGCWGDSANMWEDCLGRLNNDVAPNIQNWKEWQNIFQIQSTNNLSAFSQFNLSLFNKPLGSSFSSNQYSSFYGYANIINPDNGYGIKGNININTLPDEYQQTNILPIMHGVSFCALGGGRNAQCIHVLEDNNNFHRSINTYDFSNLIAINDYGIDFGDQQGSYYYSIGLNENFILAAEGKYLNQNTLSDYQNEISTDAGKDLWVDSQYISTIAGWERQRDLLLNYISSKISNEEISYDNIDAIRTAVANETKSTHNIPTTAFIDNLLNPKNSNNLCNNGWNKYAKEYKITSPDVYEYLILVLPYINYTIITRENSQPNNVVNSTDHWDYISKTSNQTNGSDGYITFDELVNNKKIYLGNANNTRAFQTNISIDASLQKPELSVEPYFPTIKLKDNTSIIENTKYGINDAGYLSGKTLELTKTKDGSSTYWVIPENGAKIVNTSKSNNILGVSLAINSTYQIMLPSEAYASANGTSKSAKLQDIFIDSNTNQHIGIFGLIDYYDNLSYNIPDSNLVITTDDPNGIMYVKLVNDNEVVDTAKISGFAKQETPTIDVNDANNVKLGLHQPNEVADKIYTIEIQNAPANSQVKLTSQKNLVDINLVNSLVLQASTMQINFTLTPKEVGNDTIDLQLYNPDDPSIIYQTSQFNIHIDDIWKPAVVPTITNANFENEIVLYSKAEQQPIFSFEIKDKPNDSCIADISFNIEDVLEIEWLNEQHTQFQFKFLTQKAIKLNMTIRLVDKNDSEIVYNTKTYSVIVNNGYGPDDPNIDVYTDAMPVEIIVGISIGCILGLIVIGGGSFIIIKNKIRKAR